MSKFDDQAYTVGDRLAEKLATQVDYDRMRKADESIDRLVDQTDDENWRTHRPTSLPQRFLISLSEFFSITSSQSDGSPYSDEEFQTNTAMGLPMIKCLDTGGNSYGTDYNTTSDHYSESIVDIGGTSDGTDYGSTTDRYCEPIVDIGGNSYGTDYSSTTDHRSEPIVDIGGNSYGTDYSSTTDHHSEPINDTFGRQFGDPFNDPSSSGGWD